MKLSARSLLSRPYVRILSCLRAEGPRRFNQIKESTGLNPATIDRILTAFVREQFVWLKALPKEGQRVPVLYELGPRGQALLAVHQARAREAEKHARLLGRDLVDEMAAFS